MMARQRCFSAIGDAPFAQRVDEQPDRGERRAQLVRDRRQELVLQGGEAGPAGHEDRPQRPARERGRAERQHQDAAHHRHRLRAALGEEDDAEHGDEHGGISAVSVKMSRAR